MTRWVRGIAAAAVALLVGSATLAAQAPQEYFPVVDVTRETLPAVPLVYAAYAFVWLVLMAYAFMLWRKLGRVEKELAEVTRRLAGSPRG